MSRALARLAWAGLRSRPRSALALALVVAAATGAATLAAAVTHVAETSWDAVERRTDAADVTAFAGAAQDLAGLPAAFGAIEAAGPFPMAVVALTAGARPLGLRIVALPARPAALGRPSVVEGSWLAAPGTIVLERSLARAEGVAVGDSLAGPRGERLVVSGIAISAIQAPYPQQAPGLAFASAETVARLAPSANDTGAMVALRLPAGAPADALPPPSGPAPVVLSRRADVRSEALDGARDLEAVFGVFAVLLLVAGAAIVSTVAAARASGRHRDLAISRALGLTGAQVVAVQVTEIVVAAATGALLGIGVGTAVAPLAASVGSALPGGGAVPPDPLVAVVLGAAAIGVAALAALGPARRAARSTVAAALVAESPAVVARPLGELAEALRAPLPVAMGVRDAVVDRRSARATIVTAALAVGIAVATLGMEASFSASDRAGSTMQAPPGVDLPPLPASVANVVGSGGDVRGAVYPLGLVLLGLALAHLAMGSALVVQRRLRDVAILRALGMTPRDVRTILLARTAALAGAAVVVGVPLGVLLLEGVGRARDLRSIAQAPGWQIAAVAAATVALACAAVLAAARASTTKPPPAALAEL